MKRVMRLFLGIALFSAMGCGFAIVDDQEDTIRTYGMDNDDVEFIIEEQSLRQEQ